MNSSRCTVAQSPFVLLLLYIGVLVGYTGIMEAAAPPYGVVKLPSGYQSWKMNAQGQVAATYSTPTGDTHLVLWEPSTNVTSELAVVSGWPIVNVMNVNGDIAGTFGGSGVRTNVFLWNGTTFQDLASIAGSTGMEVYDMNSSRTIIGRSIHGSSSPRPFIWSQGSYYDPTPTGAIYTNLQAINDAGDIIGAYYDDPTWEKHNFLLRNGVMQEISIPNAWNVELMSLNNLGQVVVYWNDEYGNYSGVWQDGVITDLGNLGYPYTIATSINDNGQICGLSATSDVRITGFVWQAGVMTDLGAESNTSFLSLIAMNAAGDVLARKLYPDYNDYSLMPVTYLLWRNGHLYDLRDILAADQAADLWLWPSALANDKRILARDVNSNGPNIECALMPLLDSDGDGMPDAWETLHNLNPLSPNDAAGNGDADGLTNVQEYMAGTDPWNWDSDSDGLSDGWETQYGLDPRSPNDAMADDDLDGLTTLQEYQIGTNPKAAFLLSDLSLSGEQSGYAIAINSAGHVLYSSVDSDGISHAVLSGVGDLGTFGAGASPQGLNDFDAVVGQNWDEYGAHGFVWTPSSGYSELLVNGMATTPRGINNIGQILLGDANDASLWYLRDAAANITSITPPVIPQWNTFQCVGISDSGDVLANYNDNSGGWSFRWSNGVAIPLQTAGMTYIAGNGISLQGNIVGTYKTATMPFSLPFTLDSAGFRTLLNAGTGESDIPKASNDRGVIVGGGNRVVYVERMYTTSANEAHGLVWNRGRLADLNNITSKPPGFVIEPAVSINHAGQIAANATFSGIRRAVMLQPVTDNDGDGMSNDWEVYYGLDPADSTDATDDLDGDELSNLQEYLAGTNPTQVDSDGDGMWDGWEVQYGLNPLVNDAAGNSDGDTLNNLEEFLLSQMGIPSNPKQKFTNGTTEDGMGDADRDGVPDIDEIRAGKDPADPTSFPPGHPLLDSDTDGLTDAWEIQYFGNTTAQDANGNPDGDRLTNKQELLLGTSPTNGQTGAYPDGLADQDGDNIPDIWELEDGTDPKSSASGDFATNYIVLRGRMEHLSTFGSGQLIQFNNTILRATAIGYEQAQVGSGSVARLSGVINEVSGFTNPATNLFVAERAAIRFRKGVQYRVEIIAGRTDLPFVSGKFYWSNSAANNDEPDNKFFRYEVDNRQMYFADANGVPQPANPSLLPNPDVNNTHFTQKGSASGSPEATMYPTGTLQLPPVMIYGDTNRDGQITPKDAELRSSWNKDAGAIFVVNCDSDEARTHNGRKVPDSLDIVNSGAADAEDWEIKEDADIPDIAPLRIPKIPGLAPDVKVFLTAEASALPGSLPAHKAIHVYKRIAKGEIAIWGSATEPEVAGTRSWNEREITQWVHPGSPGYVGQSDANGDYTFGVEGLFFRNTGQDLKFDGRIVFRIELRKTVNNVTQMIGFDRCEFRVAPLLFISHQQQNGESYVRGVTGSQLAIAGTTAIPAADLLDQFLQDQVEIGYSQRPGGEKMHVAFRCPKKLQHSEWPRIHLLGPNVGIYQLGSDLGGSGGDYGGNIEVLPPNAFYPSGQIIVGNPISLRLETFLKSQGEGASGYQGVSKVKTDWLGVDHVDEIFSFSSTPGKVFIADPLHALSLLRNEYNQRTPDERAKMTFFAHGSNDLPSEILVQSVDQTASGSDAGIRISTGVNYAGDLALYSKFKYVRLVSGPGQGQVAHIKQDAQNSGYGAGFLLVDKIWNTGSNAAGTSVAPMGFLQPRPQAGTKIILVEDTKFWLPVGTPAQATPALTTVGELLADPDFVKVNNEAGKAVRNSAAELINASRKQVSFVPLPVLFRRYFQDKTSYTPDVVNGQPINGVYHAPKQYGPRVGGNDLFEADVAAKIPGAVFIDDWSVYHLLDGEVHCGSATKREIPQKEWWSAISNP
ncbi:protein-arginine deiminase family protein [Verrucomicrobiota bacterium sgz303538]